MALLDNEQALTDAEAWFVDVEDAASSCVRRLNTQIAENNDETKSPSKSPGNATAKPQQTTSPKTAVKLVNVVDGWIDELDPNVETVIPEASRLVSTNEILMRSMYEKESPTVELPNFDGSPLKWPNFVQRFYEHVHRQPHFRDFRRMTTLTQHLTGNAAEMTRGLGGDTVAYVTALKTLKKRFAHPTIVAKEFLERITIGDALPDHDRDALERFQISIRDCVITLKRLAYDDDLRGSDVIRKATLRLPPRTRDRWLEKCRHIRESSQREPNLEDLNSWLEDLVTALFDPLVFTDDTKKGRQRHKTDNKTSSFATQIEDGATSDPQQSRQKPVCAACNNNHPIYRCKDYLAMSPDQRISLVKTARLCVNCLRPGHGYTTCTSTPCRIASCNKKHHSTLHENPRLFRRNQITPPVKTPPGVHGGVNAVTTTDTYHTTSTDSPGTRDSMSHGGTSATTAVRGSHVFLQIVPVNIRTPAGLVKTTYALLDNGSQSSLIRRDIADELRLEGPETNLTLGTISDQEVRHPSKRVQLTVTSVTDGEEYDIPWAWTVPALNVPAQRFKLNSDDHSSLSELASYQFENVDSSQIGLLIGANAPDAILPVEIRRNKPGSPIAVRTGLGWTIFGVANGSYKDVAGDVTSSYLIWSYTDEKFYDLMERFWLTDIFGCLHQGEPANSPGDRQALDTLDKLTKLVSGRYEVPMLWGEENPNLTNNYVMALKRFQHLQSKLRQDPDRATRYANVIKTHVESGYARKMSPQEIVRTGPVTNYLPHHDVYNVNKPNKTRVVQDATAKYKGTCLNDHSVE